MFRGKDQRHKFSQYTLIGVILFNGLFEWHPFLFIFDIVTLEFFAECINYEYVCNDGVQITKRKTCLQSPLMIWMYMAQVSDDAVT